MLAGVHSVDKMFAMDEDVKGRKGPGAASSLIDPCLFYAELAWRVLLRHTVELLWPFTGLGERVDHVEILRKGIK